MEKINNQRTLFHTSFVQFWHLGIPTSGWVSASQFCTSENQNQNWTLEPSSWQNQNFNWTLEPTSCWNSNCNHNHFLLFEFHNYFLEKVVGRSQIFTRWPPLIGFTTLQLHNLKLCVNTYIGSFDTSLANNSLILKFSLTKQNILEISNFPSQILFI